MGGKTLKIVSWNIRRMRAAWCELFRMAREEEIDLALLQEVGKGLPEGLDPPKGFEFKHVARKLDRRLGPNGPALTHWPAVVKLSNRVQVEWIKQLPSGRWPESASEMEVGGVGNLAAARVTPACGADEDSFLAVSMYARWMRPRPATGRTGSDWIYSDASAHQILTDLSGLAKAATDGTLTGDRILAAGDLNMFYGATGYELSWPERERTVWKRFKTLGLKFMGPQWPDASRRADRQPDVPRKTKNVPTFHTSRQPPKAANRQLDYAFASRGFHKRVGAYAMNGKGIIYDSAHAVQP